MCLIEVLSAFIGTFFGVFFGSLFMDRYRRRREHLRDIKEKVLKRWLEKNDLEVNLYYIDETLFEDLQNHFPNLWEKYKTKETIKIEFKRFIENTLLKDLKFYEEKLEINKKALIEDMLYRKIDGKFNITDNRLKSLSTGKDIARGEYKDLNAFKERVVQFLESEDYKQMKKKFETILEQLKKEIEIALNSQRLRGKCMFV